MLRGTMLGLALAAAAPSPAAAVLVYHRPGTHRIIAARNGGAHARQVGHGIDAQIAPDGRHALLCATRHSGEIFDVRVVSTSGGHSHVLLRDAEFGNRNIGGRPAWSPNSRSVVSADGSGFVFLIDPRHHRRRNLHAAMYGGGSFSPDSSRLALDLGDARDDSGALWLYGRRSKRFDQLGYDAALPTWGRGGLSYYDAKGLELRTGPRKRARRLVTHPPNQTVKPVDWSRSGKRLLAEVEKDAFGVERAILITPSTGAVHTVPGAFTEVSGLSRKGNRILGVIGGNVVSVEPNGTTHVLARNADHPSWSR